MGYVTPVDAPISDDWQDHRNRGSVEPGTDYACAYGTPVRAPYGGTVLSVDHSNDGGPGRYVEIRLDDGRDTRAIHLSECWVGPGQRVERGTLIGAAGGSANGNDWYYGPHVHQTLWPGAAWASDTIDFELYVGDEQLQPHQRRAATTVNRRTEPTSQSPIAGDPLLPGTVGNFDGWIHGEAVEGNDMWFRGISGDWFWSGGFEGGANPTGLADLNPVPEPNQRTATTAVNGRSMASTEGEIIATMQAGEVGDFDAWKNGEEIEGEPRWIRNTAGVWFSLKYFEPPTVDNLEDLNPPPEPPEDTEWVSVRRSYLEKLRSDIEVVLGR